MKKNVILFFSSVKKGIKYENGKSIGDFIVPWVLLIHV